MDWDDEDEQTTIYDRGGDGEGSQSLLEGSLPPPPPPPAAGRAASLPPPLASRPGASLPPPPFGRSGPSIAPPPRVSVPPAPTRPMNRVPVPPSGIGQPAPAMPAAPIPSFRGRPSSTMLGAIAAAVVGAIVVLFLLWGPRTGSLVITVSGPGNKPLDSVEIMVNGEKKCTSSPCTIEGLKPDTYYVRAHAAGYQGMADLAVPVASGAKAVQNLSLVRALGTGIKVIGEGAGLKLFVDDREVGPLPQEIKDMEPGDHAIKVAGSERFEPFEKRITVEPEQMQTIGPLKLRVLKGLATIQPGPGSDGAKVILISGADRRTLPKLPITLDIPTNQPHTLVATRRGYEQLKLPIMFEDGEVERTFEVALVESGSGIPSSGAAIATNPVHQASYVAPKSPSSPPVTTPQSTAVTTPPSGGGNGTSGGATLNINSIPVSNVLLDGRPVGTTPKMNVHVSAGSHVVTFVNGGDRKASSVTVGAGETKTVAVRF
jgi:serine/threonine-protein kinase